MRRTLLAALAAACAVALMIGGAVYSQEAPDYGPVVRVPIFTVAAPSAPAAANPGTAGATALTVTAQPGGAALSGNQTGGVGGGENHTTAAGGTSTGNAANANGGDYTVTLGAAGTGGAGAAGRPGAYTLTGGIMQIRGGTQGVTTNGAASGMELQLGYDTSSTAFIQSVNVGVSWTPLLLNPVAGGVEIGTASCTPGTGLCIAGDFKLPNSNVVGWPNTTADTGISRDGAAVVDIGNGTAANKSGTINAATANLTTSALSALFEATATNVAQVEGQIANGATAIGVKIGNANALSTAGGSGATGAQIVGFYKDAFSTETASVESDGAVSVGQIATASLRANCRDGEIAWDSTVSVLKTCKSNAWTAYEQSSDWTYSAFSGANLVTAPYELSEITPTNAGTVRDVSATVQTVGVGAGSVTVKLCQTNTTCSTAYATCTYSCTAVAGTVTTCTINTSAATTAKMMWVTTTDCGTTEPLANYTAHLTTP
jgi:hypothetical protein